MTNSETDAPTEPRRRRPLMSTCGGCGAHVSAEFARVFADANGEVHRCPRCGSTGNVRPEDA